MADEIAKPRTCVCDLCGYTGDYPSDVWYDEPDDEGDKLIADCKGCIDAEVAVDVLIREALDGLLAKAEQIATDLTPGGNTKRRNWLKSYIEQAVSHTKEALIRPRVLEVR